MSWTAFWDGDTPIYVNQRHRDKHYLCVAKSIAALIESPNCAVLDFGCGEALSADLVAARCTRLYLCESAASVRDRLRQRYSKFPKIEVVDESLVGVANDSIDVLIVNSVVQYLSMAELSASLILWRGKLAATGRLVLADVMPRRGDAVQDALSLLRFAFNDGFFFAAVLGLFRTVFSPYPRLRRDLGLLRFEEEEMLAILSGAGFSAKRLKVNLGHNQSRMTFIAKRC
jgi:hypothetical protein